MVKQVGTRTFSHIILFTCLLIWGVFGSSCQHQSTAKTAFYYWKTNYSLNKDQQQLLKNTAGQNLYLHLFDIHWDANRQQVTPNARLSITTPLTGAQVTPVVFITNQTFLHTTPGGIDSLAFKTARLVEQMTGSVHINYKKIQFDCDWSDDTREKYFAYLKAFKKYNEHALEATIRLHQVKYRERTGIPPVERGILMFYNMGHLTALGNDNSIYNENDAGRYLARLDSYPLPLDVALPLFSWSIHSRGGHIQQIYPQINRHDLDDQQNFQREGNHYKAVRSFFLKGVYIQENDNFKIEETDARLLKKAADQLSVKLKPLPERTVIFYEIANINLSEFDSKTLSTITARF